ncbi:P-loop NTPase family protein [Hymenobacter psychrophilus]|uniref:AAA domain-containing protein n=1 Tax=Hymenobacter psychrophilus TaxID=651662 RepID=A0A1H3PA07_9BACT|nr:hypothetical protein [Hymenobacter psychrophilus]SDY97927.1 AAA domain-containing protein [Hymenobacter psychrophilus]
MSINPFAPAAPVHRAPAAAPPQAPLPSAASQLRIISPEEAKAEALDFYRHGLGNGETTHWPCLNEYWTWMRKEITCITGYPNHGKSRFIHHAMLIKSAFDGWKFAVYVPENESDFYVEMAQMLVGRTANIKFADRRMSEQQLEQAIDWLAAHFFVVIAPEGATPKQLLDSFEQLHEARGLDGVLIDPWNQLMHSFQSREDIYLSEQYSMLKRFAIRLNLALVMTAHPAGSVKDKNGKLVVPDAYSISGGKMTNNKFDNVMATFRPAFPDPAVELWVHKIKKQGRVGKPGQLNLTYDLSQSRYFPEIGDAQHPLETVSFNAPGAVPAINDFPASQFDTDPAATRKGPAPF